MELNPVFVRIAREYFGHEDRKDRMTTFTADGVDFLKEAVQKG